MDFDGVRNGFMDVQAAQKAKVELEQNIAKLLQAFSEKTNLTVDRVDIIPTGIVGKRTPIYRVETEVKL